MLFVDPTSDLNDRDFVSAGCGHLVKLSILSLISFAVENNRFRHIAKCIIEARNNSSKVGWMSETKMVPDFLIC